MRVKRKFFLIYAIFFMILGFLLIYYEKYRIPYERAKVQDVEKKSVFIIKKDIPMNTMLTDKVIQESMEKREIPVEYVPVNAITNEAAMYNKKTVTNLYENSYVYEENLVTEEEGFEDGEQLYEFPLNTANAVVKKVKPNSYVTVWVRYPDRRDSECVIPKIKLYDLVDSTGQTVTDITGEVAHGIIKATDYEMQLDLEAARKFEIYLTLYGENMTTPPKKTFHRDQIEDIDVQQE